MDHEHRLDAVLEEIVRRWGIPGLAVAVVEGEAVAYARTFGVQSLDTGVPLTPTSMYCIQSITKCFVASAVMQLVEAGQVALDAPVVGYLPYFRLDSERSTEITVHQLLSHSSGMPDLSELEYDDLLARPEVDAGAAERYVRALGSRRLAHDPGERFLYSNLGYSVLGDLIAKVSGLTFEDYLLRYVLLPAGMTDSTCLPTDVDRRRLIMPHLRAPGLIVNPVYPYHRGDAPASFLHTTLVDMCQWAITCLRRGADGAPRILSPASYDRMWAPAAWRGAPPLREHMGLGWNLGHFEGARTVSHGGGGFGWSSQLVLLPDERRAAVIFSNEESSAIYRLTGAVLRAMLGLEPQVGSVSWMVPISQALAMGGISAARDRCAALRHATTGEYFSNDYELVGLAIQLMDAGRLDLAIEVLELNLETFPDSVESASLLAELQLRRGVPASAGAAAPKP